MLLLRLAAGNKTADAPALISTLPVDVKPKINLESRTTTGQNKAAKGRHQKVPSSAAATTTTTSPVIQNAADSNDDAGQQQSVRTQGGDVVTSARLLDLGKRLIEASREGKLDQVRHLVQEAGAPFTSDWLGTTALHAAAQRGFAEIANILVQGGVNRDARTKLERTALHLAAQSGSAEIVDLLLNHGSDVNARDMLKMSPLHWAVERGHVLVAERLLLAGADVNSCNKFRLTPIDIARESGSYEMIGLFKNWSAGGQTKVEGALNPPELLAKNPAQILAMANAGVGKDILDLDYHLAFVEGAAQSGGGDSMLDNDESCLDLVGLEWNKCDFDPGLFLPSESDDEPKVEYLMKVVEELQKENQQLRQKVEQLSTIEP